LAGSPRGADRLVVDGEEEALFVADERGFLETLFAVDAPVVIDAGLDPALLFHGRRKHTPGGVAGLYTAWRLVIDNAAVTGLQPSHVCSFGVS
jgi:hypothetical protein